MTFRRVLHDVYRLLFVFIGLAPASTGAL
jgi:hypothetical protein